MSTSRPMYRMRQFWETVRAQEPTDRQLERAREVSERVLAEM